MERLKHYPAFLGGIALLLEIVISVIVAPIIDDMRSQHRALREDMKAHIERLEAELQGVRVETFQQFETQQHHIKDTEHLLDRINRLEARSYDQQQHEH